MADLGIRGSREEEGSAEEEEDEDEVGRAAGLAEIEDQEVGLAVTAESLAAGPVTAGSLNLDQSQGECLAINPDQNQRIAEMQIFLVDHEKIDLVTGGLARAAIQSKGQNLEVDLKMTSWIWYCI